MSTGPRSAAASSVSPTVASGGVREHRRRHVREVPVPLRRAEQPVGQHVALRDRDRGQVQRSVTSPMAIDVRHAGAVLGIDRDRAVLGRAARRHPPARARACSARGRWRRTRGRPRSSRHRRASAHLPVRRHLDRGGRARRHGCGCPAPCSASPSASRRSWSKPRSGRRWRQHERHLRAEPGEDAGELDGDVAAADQHDALRQRRADRTPRPR